MVDHRKKLQKMMIDITQKMTMVLGGKKKRNTIVEKKIMVVVIVIEEMIIELHHIKKKIHTEKRIFLIGKMMITERKIVTQVGKKIITPIERKIISLIVMVIHTDKTTEKITKMTEKIVLIFSIAKMFILERNAENLALGAEQKKTKKKKRLIF
eukprot:Lithocolla_globosa_v1_NODE_4297_length_1469_cov_6.948373.p4 type:complete len:154 gc:universal NODE_4297_length_1469_cov_6.948373:465-4(-)